MKTFRRQMLDNFLDAHKDIMQGDVIDIGGKKEKKRGNFTPPLSQVRSWHYVNIDKSTNPDFWCNAENIPVKDESYDTAILCEVLEHLEDPEKVLREAFRILKKGGNLIMSTPFLFPIHADPYDFQRWTDTKIRVMLESIGFSDIEITPMGGLGAVIHDLLLVSFNKAKNKYLKSLGFICILLLRPLLSTFEKTSKSKDMVSTGYFVLAKK